MKNLVALCGLCFSLTLSAAAPISAQGNAVRAEPVAKPPVRLVIHAGRLLDTRTGNYASNVFILIEGDRDAVK